MQTKLSISKILGATSLLALVSASPALADTAPVENGASQISITLTGDNGGTCVLDHDSAAAGPVSFQVTNKSATSISEVELLSGNRILGEKENLAPGLPTVGFTVTLGGGDYQIYCPGAGKDKLAFTVTGEAKKASGDISDLLKDGTKGYAHYVDGMVESMVTAVGRLKGDIDAGDLKAAKAEYPVARSFYERIESDVEGFVLPGHDVTDNSGNLDYLIDMRASNLDPAVGWHGFHAIRLVEAAHDAFGGIAGLVLAGEDRDRPADRHLGGRQEFRSINGFPARGRRKGIERLDAGLFCQATKPLQSAEGTGHRLPIQPVCLGKALSEPAQDLFVEEDRQSATIALINDEADRIGADIDDADGPTADDSPLTQGLNRIVRARLFVLR